MIAKDRNADYNAVTRTSDNMIADAVTPAFIRPEPSGPEHSTVTCPLCTVPVVLLEGGLRVEGRCPGCTVLVRMTKDGPVLAGWMGGGDMKLAGRALRNLPPISFDACEEHVGTTVGYYRHKAAAEKPCEPCAEAFRVYNRERKQRRKQAQVDARKPCGTAAAWRRHQKRGERPCDACREAKKAYDAMLRRRKKKAAA